MTVTVTHNDPFIDVTRGPYNARGDGVTDDTDAIMAVRDALYDAGGGEMFFPPGIYKITSALDIDMGRIAIIGSGRGVTTIKQFTANTPVLRWTGDTAADGSNHVFIRIAHIALEHNALPSAATPLQYGIMYRPSADGSGATPSGIAYSRFEDLRIANCYVGIGSWATGTGYSVFWGDEFQDVLVHDTYYSAFKMSSGPESTGGTGQPHLTFSNCQIINNTLTLSGGVDPVGPALAVSGALGLVIDHLNIEDWANLIIECTGGYTHQFTGIRTERHRLTGNYPFVLYLGNGNFTVNGFELNYRSHHAGYARGIVAADAKVRASGVLLSRDAAASTTSMPVYAYSGDPSIAEIIGDTPTLLGTGTAEYVDPGWEPTAQYVRVTIDGLPPKVTALPTASATYRGRSFRVEGGAGVADVTSICQKNAADAYVWSAIV